MDKLIDKLLNIFEIVALACGTIAMVVFVGLLISFTYHCIMGIFG